MRFAIPLCRSFFFVAWPLMVLWDEIGLCRKTSFQAPKNCFFRTCLDCFQPLQINMWVDMGTWSIVFPNNLKKTEALRKNNFSSSEKLFYSHMLGMLPILTNWRIARPAGIRTFDLQGWSPTRWALRYRSLHTNLMKFRQAWFCQKKSGSNFFPRCSHET